MRRRRPNTPEVTPAETVPIVSPVPEGVSSPEDQNGISDSNPRRSTVSTSASSSVSESPAPPSSSDARSSTPLTPTRTLPSLHPNRTTPGAPSASAESRPRRTTTQPGAHPSRTGTSTTARRTTTRNGTARNGNGSGASELTARINALKQHLNRAQQPMRDRRGRASGIPRPTSRMSAANTSGILSPSSSFSTWGPSPIPSSTSGIPRPRASIDRPSGLPRLSNTLHRSPSATTGLGGTPFGRVRTRPTSQLTYYQDHSPPRPPSRSLLYSSQPPSHHRPYSPTVTRPFSPAMMNRTYSPTKPTGLPRLSTTTSQHTRRHSQALTNLGSLNAALPAVSPADRLVARSALDRDHRVRSPSQR